MHKNVTMLLARLLASDSVVGISDFWYSCVCADPPTKECAARKRRLAARVKSAHTTLEVLSKGHWRDDPTPFIT